MSKFIVYYSDGKIKSFGSCSEADIPLQVTGNPGTLAVEGTIPSGGKKEDYYIVDSKVVKK